MRWALAVVGVHTVHTQTTVLAAVTWAVVDVVLTVLTREAWQTQGKSESVRDDVKRWGSTREADKEGVTLAWVNNQTTVLLSLLSPRT